MKPTSSLTAGVLLQEGAGSGEPSRALDLFQKSVFYDPLALK